MGNRGTALKQSGEVKKVDEFKNLGSVIKCNGDCGSLRKWVKRRRECRQAGTHGEKCQALLYIMWWIDTCKMRWVEVGGGEWEALLDSHKTSDDVWPEDCDVKNKEILFWLYKCSHEDWQWSLTLTLTDEQRHSEPREIIKNYKTIQCFVHCPDFDITALRHERNEHTQWTIEKAERLL